MATTIPAKQLQTVGETPDELKSLLLDRETGWCSGDHTFYYRDGDELRAVGKDEILVLTYGEPTAGILDTDYDKLIGREYKTAILIYDTGSTQSIATLATIGSTTRFVSLNASLKKIFVFSVEPVSSSGRHPVSQSEISLGGGSSYTEGVAIEFGENGAINVKAGEGLTVNESNELCVALDMSSLELVDGVITIKKEIVDVTDEMIELLHDMDRKVTSTFPFAHISKTYDFIVSGHRNGNVMIGQLFLCTVAQTLRTDGDCPTFLSVYVGDTVYGGDICLGLYEFDPDANDGSGSTYWLCDTGPVRLKSGVNHFPVKYLMATTTARPKIKMESGKYYYAVLAIRTTSDPGQPANGLYMAGGDPYTTWFNSATPAISRIEQNIGTSGTSPVIDWSGNASVLENAWFQSNSEARDIPRLFMLVSNRKIGEVPPSEDPFLDYSSNYTLAHINELGDLFACNKVSNWGNAVVMQRVTPAKNITVHKITYIDMHNYAGPNEHWDAAPTPLILDGSTYACVRSRSDANITRGNKDGATIDGTHYLHEYTLTLDFEMVAGMSYWVAAMLGCNNPGQNTPVVEFTAPADVSNKDLLLVGDFYNTAQSSTNELQNGAGKTVCIIEDASGNKYMF